MTKKRIHFFVSPAILFIASLGSLANISISPTSLELSESSPTGEIILENQGSEAKLFEVSKKKWMQKDTKDIFEDTDDVLVIPLSALILPAKKQKFRIILRKFAASETQNNYRLFFVETRKRSPAKSGLFFLLNINIPIFSNGKNLNLSFDPQWSIAQTSDKTNAELLLKNNGAKTFVITNLQLSDKSSFSDAHMHYLLPGSSYKWKVPLKANKSDVVKISYLIFGKPRTVDLKLIPPKSLQPAK